jgi:hypothetical protein
VVEQAAAAEEAVLAAGHLQAAAVDDELRAFHDAQINIVPDLGPVRGGGQRTHFRVLAHAVADLERLYPLAAAASLVVDVLGDPRRADEAHRGDV